MNAINIINHSNPDMIAGAKSAYTGTSTAELQAWLDAEVKWKGAGRMTAAEVEAAEGAYLAHMAAVSDISRQADLSQVADDSITAMMMNPADGSGTLTALAQAIAIVDARVQALATAASIDLDALVPPDLIAARQSLLDSQAKAAWVRQVLVSAKVHAAKPDKDKLQAFLDSHAATAIALLPDPATVDWAL